MNQETLLKTIIIILLICVFCFFICILGTLIHPLVSNTNTRDFHFSIKESFQNLFASLRRWLIEYKEEKVKRRIEKEMERRQRIPGISPREVITLRNRRKGFTGIYIIYNYTKGMYYVGQAQNVFQRCGNHFLGKGNADIYADYKYGDIFFIEFRSLVDSEYDNLDDLERYYINKYDSVRYGYNRKKGNR